MPRGVVVGVLAAVALVAPAAHAGQRGCGATCSTEFDAALEVACGDCVAAPLIDRDDCLQTVDDDFPSCVDGCPSFPGRCTITHECVDGCRARRASQRATCTSRFQHRIRTECTGGGLCLAQARKARRQCLRKCRHGGSQSARRAAASAAGNPCACQQTCIVGIVGDCYDECQDRCEGDGMALSICRGACRDAQCDRLQTACTTSAGSGTNAYQLCCAACGNCEDAVDCEATSTTTSTSRTTTSSSTSTTSTTVR